MAVRKERWRDEHQGDELGVGAAANTQFKADPDGLG